MRRSQHLYAMCTDTNSSDDSERLQCSKRKSSVNITHKLHLRAHSDDIQESTLHEVFRLPGGYIGYVLGGVPNHCFFEFVPA